MKEKNQSFEAIREYFSSEDYQTSQVGEKLILNFQYEGVFEDREEEWNCSVIAKENLSFKKVVFFSFVPFKILKNQTESVAELLNKINYVEEIGSFDIKYDTGQVRCKTSVEILTDNITKGILFCLMENNIKLMGKYIPIIDQVNKGELLPMDAIDDDDYDNYI